MGCGVHVSCLDKGNRIEGGGGDIRPIWADDGLGEGQGEGQGEGEGEGDERTNERNGTRDRDQDDLEGGGRVDMSQRR